MEDLVDLLSDGVTYHHAGLSRDARAAVEAAFRGHHLKVISCTPTLAAGVNLPARLVVVKDVFRTRRVVLSTGELLNMLGRAGRPGKVESGSGLALVESKLMDDEEFSRLQIAIMDGTGNHDGGHPQFRPRETCKHLACAIHTLLFDEGVEPEVRNRALYACMHRFRRTLDLGTKIGVALRLLAEWGLIEQVPGALAATGVGAIASG